LIALIYQLNMDRNKLTLSKPQFEAIKLQIRVELNKCKPKLNWLPISKISPPQKKHFTNSSIMKNTLQLSNKQNTPLDSTPKGKKHFK
jgi:hypothetical protein